MQTKEEKARLKRKGSITLDVPAWAHSCGCRSHICPSQALSIGLQAVELDPKRAALRELPCTNCMARGFLRHFKCYETLLPSTDGVSLISVYGKETTGSQPCSQVMTELPVKFGLNTSSQQTQRDSTIFNICSVTNVF